MRFSEKERQLYASKIIDLGNLAIVALVFGQMISPEKIKLGIFGFGIIFYLICMVLSHVLHKEVK